jgi:hypothetical protein
MKKVVAVTPVYCGKLWRQLRRRARSLVVLAFLVPLVQLLAQSSEVEDVEFFRANLPQLRAAHPDQFNTPEKMQAAWKRFLETRALARTARTLGYADRPDLKYRIEQMLAQELILRDAEKAKPIHTITEAEIDAHLARHREKFEAVAQMSAHEIVFRFDPTKPDERSSKLARAREIRQVLGAGPVALEQFLEAIRAYSDPDFVHTNGGYLGVFSVSAVSNAAPPMAKSAAAELLATGRVGDISDVHEFGPAWRIYRLSGYREPVAGSSAAVRDGVRRALYLQAREQRIRALAAQSGMNLDLPLSQQQMSELLATAAANRVSAADLPPSPAGADIPLPVPVSAHQSSKQ